MGLRAVRGWLVGLVACGLAGLLPAGRGARAEEPAAAAPETIFVGAYVTLIHGIDLKAGSFGVDFWVWFRWSGHGPSPLDSFEVIGGRVLSKSNVIRKSLAGGLEYHAARVSASILQPWDLRRFPFDDHTLHIRIEDSERDALTAVYAADSVNAGIDPDVRVSGWRVAGHEDAVIEQVYRSNYGDTSLPTGAHARYSRYVFSARLERDGAGRFFKFFAGLFIATLASWCAFFVRPKDAGPRVSVSIGALFAAAAVTIAINNQMPDAGALTFADKMVFLSLGTILASLIGTVSALALHYREREALHRRLDRVGQFAVPIVYAAILWQILP